VIVTSSSSVPLWKQFLNYFSAVRAIAAGFVAVIGSVTGMYVTHVIDWPYFIAGFVIGFVLILWWILIVLFTNKLHPNSSDDINNNGAGIGSESNELSD